MNPNETSDNGTRSIFYNGEQVEQPGTSSLNPMESPEQIIYSIPDDQVLFNIFLKPDESDSTRCTGPCLCGECHMVQSLLSFLGDLDPWYNIIPSPVGTERDHGSSPPTVSPVSYSCLTMPSTPEDAEALNAMEGAKSAIVSNSGNCINMSNPENSVLPAELSRPGCSRTCTGCHDARRSTAAEVSIERSKFFKGVTQKKNSDKWTCEIRIAKKLLKDSKLKTKGKQWLGTFDTPCQAARALHVGRFLLSDKKRKSTTNAANFEQSSKTILSEFKDFMRGKPLDEELLHRVKKLANDYGKNGYL